MSRKSSFSFKAALLLSATASISGCNFFERMSEVGEQPKISRIQDPTQAPNYHPVSMPMPAPTSPPNGTNSLWRSGSRAFFKDQRATEIGDILTVAISINESGSLSNKTSTGTTGSEAMGVPNFFGLESSIGKVFAGSTASSLVSVNSSSGMSGTGTSARSEQVTINLAATVTQKLPNGNLVIAGKQELRVNGDLRELSVQGIIRIEDISSLNTITSDKIAEARIVYGGRGTLADVQQPRYGQQIFDTIAPF
ncbi:flagellar basal body L-ring protein FlgH [Telmatospirillum siberiense]|uniref:Flagellar L-ring protein n=1 Tax=Telmatospirillum siberiense TaxID=382514 RepID=A0A2N3Q028_9PROT|nr:flagellar basal body L-ring protein FlgH [Telmatospirillum siberiense]PKU26009.1 flagellar basal body L-ring protein [Telmatospirillum siberiense]